MIHALSAVPLLVLAIPFAAIQAARAEALGPLVVVLEGAELLGQCSRSAPADGEGTWRPTGADIDRLEAQLPTVLASSALAGQRMPELPTAAAVRVGWMRQYAGIVRNGRRYVYGSFFPARGFADDPRWRNEAVRICGGGPLVFGVEMDAETHAITHRSFNGRR
ncbi:hypothetical protein [Aureimonas jatrophae]|uniref:Uncharacterized protein n=1 Tax=Aureimonas jatrophae TaxID=1166073 RepID=A0A1H0D2W6_9HYPH|nr:hypothetical protein [Aureimonas jatrophae]MBB3951679.1 hypothetical protein [Aureimonas jatrophae]SDN64416.1 hypothetical protein SAMN05192530_101571 [Aureimonas jatrophae]